MQGNIVVSPTDTFGLCISRKYCFGVRVERDEWSILSVKRSLCVKQMAGYSTGSIGPEKNLVYARVAWWQPLQGPPGYWRLIWAQLGETEGQKTELLQ